MSVMLTDYVDGYQHVGIPTDDMEKTRNFYEGLGFKLKYATENCGNKVCFFEHAGVLVETYEKSEGATNKTGSIDHIALNCTDIVACVNAARKAGYVFNEGPGFLPFWDHGVMYVTILGPNSEVVEFIQKFSSESEKERALRECGF